MNKYCLIILSTYQCKYKKKNVLKRAFITSAKKYLVVSGLQPGGVAGGAASFLCLSDTIYMETITSRRLYFCTTYDCFSCSTFPTSQLTQKLYYLPRFQSEQE